MYQDMYDGICQNTKKMNIYNPLCPTCSPTIVWGAFHSGSKSPLVLPDRYLTVELYGGIFRNNLLSFARQQFGDNYHYQADNATPHRVWAVFDFFQQGNATNM